MNLDINDFDFSYSEHFMGKDKEPLCLTCSTECANGDEPTSCADYKRYLCRCTWCGRFVSYEGKDGSRYTMSMGLTCKRCDNGRY